MNIEIDNKTDTQARLAGRSTLARLDQIDRVAGREGNTLARKSAHAIQTQQQASTPEWSRLPVHTQPNPAGIHLGNGHHCSHCYAQSCSLTSL